MGYNDYGNITHAKVFGRNGTSGKYIHTQNVYGSDTNYNYLSSSIDQRGLETFYNYSNLTGLLNWVKMPISKISDTYAVTNYTYDADSKYLTSVSQENAAPMVQYGYYKGNLAKITTGFTTAGVEALQGQVSYYMDYDRNDNMTTVSTESNGENVTLKQNTYYDTGNLSETTFATGDKISYTYDLQDRVDSVSYTPPGGTMSLIQRFSYNSNGLLGKGTYYTEGTPVSTEYDYDFADRVISTYNTKGFGTNRIEYDKNNMNTRYNSYLNSSRARLNYVTGYEYNNVNNMTKMKINALRYGETLSETYTYDDLSRFSGSMVATQEGTKINTSVTYADGVDSTKTTSLMKQYRIRYSDATNPEYTFNYSYYDRAGNITTLQTLKGDGSSRTSTFNYDNLNQLQTALNVCGRSYSYAYDNRGNITSWLSLGRGKATYTYGNFDRLTSFTYMDNTRNYTYDNTGNPLTISNLSGSNSAVLTWQQDRQLKRFVLGSSVDNTYYYNEDGLLSRVDKKNGEKIHYYYSDGDLEYEERLDASGNLTLVLKYFYDAEGNVKYLLKKTDQFNNPYAFSLYYYMKNGQNDVIGLIRVKTQSGAGNVDDRTLVAEYSYEPYGEIDSVSNYAGETIGDLNPLRYRSYYYDTDTGWYRLSTRYYDATVGRFINADNLDILNADQDHLFEHNLYLYCFNNPINKYDEDGHYALPAAAAAVGGVGIIIGKIVLTGVAIVVTVKTAKSIYRYFSKSKSKADPYARQGQKKQGRERKNKSRQSPNWKPRSKAKKPKSHTPGKDHRKY